MVVAEDITTTQNSNTDMSNSSSNAKYNSYEHQQQHEANLHNENHTNFIEKNYLLSQNNKKNPIIITEENHINMQKINGFKKENDEKNFSTNDPEMNPINGHIHEPPDGGVRAWAIMIGSFLINGILFSVINSYSPIYGNLKQRLNDAGLSDTAEKAAIVGSLQLGTTFGMSPVAGILTKKIGLPVTTFLGGLIASLGVLISAFVLDSVETLYLTYGVMFGIGSSLAYGPSLIILGHYFKRHLGLVNGIVTAGSSIFTTVMPHFMDFIIKNYGLKTLMISLGALTCSIMPCACLFKPIALKNTCPVVEKPKITHDTTLCEKLKNKINTSVLRKKKYIIWASAMTIALLGYHVPYVHVGKFVQENFGSEDGNFPITCLGITSGIGRLIFGYIADLPSVNKILLQQVAFTCLGGLMMLLSVTTSYSMLLIIYSGMGLFDGCFISLLGSIAYEFCGHEHATAAISLLLGMCAIPVIAGSAFAARLYDRTGSYSLTFIISGVPPIIAALMMFLTRCVKNDSNENSTDPAGESLTKPNGQTDSTMSTARTEIIAEVKKDKELQEI
ncbi:monocarboxylate transporter 10 isoform X2 [Leptopilina heterotoma]|uniref:monocarboxylate transporter 10 isoform X2 n=1 Tax=Leptopilina heterotoma TaxID=63436 RepID=UPI001CA9FB60|nr:monocarboxylate transporter 10 isoform X2 [Leptopilina heterotoma]